MKTNLILAIALVALSAAGAPSPSDKPLRIAVVGLVHGHVAGFFNNALKRTDIQIVGIVEPDRSLFDKYAQRHHLSASLYFANLDDLLAHAAPEAVLAYTSTYGHLGVVEECAKHGIPVMMEKPLTVSYKDALAMAKAAEAGKIHVLVNYETTWYASNKRAYDLVRSGELGDVRKVVVHDGHQGPREIGVQPEFFKILTDPKLNGAGALFDFGCYGADLMTWIMNGQAPQTVTAVTQQIKPEIYPNVDDEANVILTYPKAVAILQPSWNWPYSRKDMEVYGRTGAVTTVLRDKVIVRRGEAKPSEEDAAPLAAPYDDSLRYLTAVVRGQIEEDGDLSSLKTNLVVSEILDAARQSAKTGKTVSLPLNE